MSRCTVADTDYEKHYFDSRSCISRKLDWLKKERAESSNAESYYEVGTLEDCDLCPECEKVPPLLKQRKVLKLERGAVLRSINILGRTKEDEINNGQMPYMPSPTG
ncbi:MAG TPA: hypothetical protein VMS08_00450 [Candidatus Saccharimonadia bacterium]|nr:hypothetical protein [Candidatus Saccharimonadia bacterium]